MSSSDSHSHSNANFVALLESRRGKVVSHTGGWVAGKGVFSHGFSMLDELVGKKSYFQLLVLNATGKLVERRFADWLEAVYGCLSWPDPRIWCNQIAALSGAARTSALAATTMGCLASDSTSYGVLPLIAGVNFIKDALIEQQNGASAAAIVERVVAAQRGKPNIMGYRRPIAKGDERIVALSRVARELGFEEGPHLRLAYELDGVLRERFDEGMNVNGYGSAFFADCGFSAEEVYQMCTLLVASGATACYLDARGQRPETFTPLRCDDIAYEGAPCRPVPTR